ncbi:MAG: LysM peptidoglycan-binding domain-containing protein [Planctomycetes bacterium]|nr:LysM peptidoglycan-binding domain-containing protein [Planctomycetota bacterium]
MARETKYGLSLIAVLCVGLVAAIGWRVSKEVGKPHAADTSLVVADPNSAKPSVEPPKLLLRAEGDRVTGEATPPTPATPAPVTQIRPKSDSWARAQLASAAEPSPMPPRQRYPLMPASASTEPKPTLSPEENPPISEPATMPHTSYRPEDSAATAPPRPSDDDAAPQRSTAIPLRTRMLPAADATAAPRASQEAITVAAEQPIGRSRYGDPAFNAPVPVAGPVEAAPNEPAAEQRPYRRPEFGTAAPRPMAPAPRPAFAPAGDRGDGTAIVRPNDTFWTISERAYGTGSYFKALIRHNSDKHPNPDQLAVGDTVLVPPASELTQKFPQLCPKPRRGGEAGIRNAAAPMTAAGGRAYEVREGDTLFDIARFELGDGARWIEIYQMNRDQLTDDFHYLKPGSTLMLPGRQRQSADRVAREPNDVRQR